MSIEFLPPSLTPSEPAFTQPAAPPPASDPLAKGLPACTEGQIRYRVNRLSKEFGLNYHDREDLAQDLRREMFKAMQRYDSSRSKVGYFMRVVADLWYCSKARDLRVRESRRPVSIDAYPEALGREEVSPDGLSLDARAIIARLPEELKTLAILLTTNSPAEVARILGVHRSTVTRHIQNYLRPAFTILCNTRPDPAER